MSFFFDEGSDTKKSKTSNQIPLHTAERLQCAVCPLKKSSASNPDITPWGNDSPEIYFLGEAPDEVDDKEGRPFVGTSGKLLTGLIPKEYQNKYRLNNVIRTHPPENRIPTPIEIACCRKSIIEDIKKTQPAVIVAVGSTALNWLFYEHEAQDIAKWRGRFFTVALDGFITKGYCINHPSYILRNQRTSKDGKPLKGDLDYLFEADLNNLFNEYKRSPLSIPPTAPLDGVTYTEGLKSDFELKKVLSWLRQLSEESIVAIDYETTHLRPYTPDSKILTVAIGTDKKVYAFPIAYPNAWNRDQLNQVHEAFRNFLLNKKVQKIAHNTKFELEWSGYMYGNDILYNSVWHDTQGQAYILDERKGTHNLDFLIRQHFGFWLKELSPMDKSNMLAQPLEKILPYNGMDTKWTFSLYKLQEKLIKNERTLIRLYKQLMDEMVMLTQIQLRGVHFDHHWCHKLREQYTTELTVVEKAILELPEVATYKQSYNQPFNPASPTHLITIFKDILGLGEQLKTDTGKYTTDESALSKLTNVPLAQHMLEYRGLAKKISTYIDPMPTFVMPDGKIHTTYNPYETSTGRLCVAKGTMIEIMRDFFTNPLGIPVEDVKPGDMAYTYNDDLNVVLRKVTWAGKTGTKKVMRLHWIGTGNRTSGHLDLTCNHPVRTITGEYKRADELEIGDRVLSLTRTIKNGRSFEKYFSSTLPNNHKIVKIEWLDNVVDVYDLGVEDTHNFIANGIAISNSADSPNLQNLPSKTGKEPRGMFCAPKDHILVCCDYGQIEARLIGAASQDANFCKALWDDYDVHMEWAKRIAETYPKVIGGERFLDDKKVMKAFRSKIKNSWVFPAFYGAAPKSISIGLKIPQDVVEDLFDEFWDQFATVRKWQRWLLKRYQQLGYVETFFGRRRHAPLTMNAVINSPIQGGASDFCVLSMIELNKLGINVVLNVHDEIGFYIPESELEEQVEIIVQEMTRPKLNWLNIPISVEVKMGQNWFEMEEVATFLSTDFYSVPNKLLDFTTLYDSPKLV